MLRKIVWGAVLLGLAGMTAPRQVEAQQHSVSFGAGYFAVRGEDARPANDVLVRNLTDLQFAIADFSNIAAGGDWLVGVGEYVEAGIGLGFYRRTVPSVYRDFINVDGSEIEQDLRLRIAPVTLTARFLPLGSRGAVQPYVGGGIAFYAWRYSEVGEFVDFRDSSIFRERFVAEGRDSGPVLLGGLRVPVGGRLALGGEVRFHRGRGAIDAGAGLLGDEIDLGGVTSQITFHVRF